MEQNRSWDRENRDHTGLLRLGKRTGADAPLASRLTYPKAALAKEVIPVLDAVNGV